MNYSSGIITIKCPQCNKQYLPNSNHECVSDLVSTIIVTGWICPRCNNCISPHKNMCPKCSAPTVTVTSVS